MSSPLLFTFSAENTLESRLFFHNLTPVSSTLPENINDLRRFFVALSTVFLQERFQTQGLTAAARFRYNR
jgi:hypothetical protein